MCLQISPSFWRSQNLCSCPSIYLRLPFSQPITSMRNLWRTSLSLLRQYPILWIPVIVARVISFNLHWIDDPLRRNVGLRLMPWLMHTHAHSVLSGSITTGVPDAVVTRKVMALTTPIHFAIAFLGDFALACALIAVAAILHSFATTGRSTVRVAAAPISSSSYRVSIFCLKLLGLDLISGWIISFLAPSVISFLNHGGLEKLFSLSLKSQIALERSPLLIDLIDHLWILPITLGVVYVMAPLQLHLLQPPDRLPDPNQRKKARLASMSAAVAISALGVLSFAAQQSLFQLIFRTDLHVYLIGTISSLFIATPYVPLYIAFYLIANPDSPIIASSINPPKSKESPDHLTAGSQPSAFPTAAHPRDPSAPSSDHPEPSGLLPERSRPQAG